MTGSAFAYSKYATLVEPQQKAVVEFHGERLPTSEPTLRSAIAKAESHAHKIKMGHEKRTGSIEIWLVNDNDERIGTKPYRSIWCGGKLTLKV